jgi:hypothetical protein
MKIVCHGEAIISAAVVTPMSAKMGEGMRQDRSVPYFHESTVRAAVEIPHSLDYHPLSSSSLLFSSLYFNCFVYRWIYYIRRERESVKV